MNDLFSKISFKYDRLDDSLRFLLFIIPFSIANIMFTGSGEIFNIRNYFYIKMTGGLILMFYILWGLHRAFGKNKIMYSLIYYFLIISAGITAYFNI